MKGFIDTVKCPLVILYSFYIGVYIIIAPLNFLFRVPILSLITIKNFNDIKTDHKWRKE